MQPSNTTTTRYGPYKFPFIFPGDLLPEKTSLLNREYQTGCLPYTDACNLHGWPWIASPSNSAEMLSYGTTLRSFYAVGLCRSRSAPCILTNVKWEHLFLLSHLSSAELVIIPTLQSGEWSTKQWSDLAEATLQASAWSRNPAQTGKLQVLHSTKRGHIILIRLTCDAFGKIYLVEGWQNL